MAHARAIRSAWSRFTMTPVDWALLGFMFFVGLVWWMSSAQLLVASGWRDNGRVLSCVYFTGVRVTEWQYLNTVPGIEKFTCPLLKLG